MKISILFLAALFAVSWTAAVRAADDKPAGDRVAVDRGDRDDRDDGDEPPPPPRRREGPPRERDDDRDEAPREGKRPRGGHGGPGFMGRGAPDPEMKEKHEKYRDAAMKVRELGHKLAKEGGDKAAAKAEAKKAVAELFDAKLALDTAMVSKMEKHLAEAKEKLAKRKAARERLIDEKAARVVGDGDDAWDD